MDERFELTHYSLRRKFFKMFGASFQIFDQDGRQLFYSKQKAFKLREDIRLYGDESLREELLVMKARQIIDFGATYDVIDMTTGRNVGALRRQGFKSLFRDRWTILNEDGAEIGEIQEDQAILAFLRRYITTLIPQSYHAIIGGVESATFSQHFNPFIFKMDLDFSADTEHRFDRRLGIAAMILLAAIEGRQN